MLRKAAMVFGAVFLIIGIGGFIPALTTTDGEGMELLLGIFMVGALHNVIHLLSGVGALLGSSSEKYARLYFQVFSIVYSVVTVVGFAQGDTVLGLIHVNLADNVLHLAIAAVTLYLGFGTPADSKKTA